MRHQMVTPASSLPSLMMPCPVCAGRMVFHGQRAIAADIEDSVFACRRCGVELIRTTVLKASVSTEPKPEAA